MSRQTPFHLPLFEGGAVANIGSVVKEVSLSAAFEDMYVSTYDTVQNIQTKAPGLTMRFLESITGLYKPDI
ncbi:MAG: hypothetical protein ACXADC_08905 [Candidatus Thorarchaeota archaeon]